MRAIVIAGGRGSRLGPMTEAVPKPMVEVGGKPLLHRAVERFREAGIEDVVVVRGYMRDRVSHPAVRYVDHTAWERTNVLGAVLAAVGELEGDVVVAYSDIVFDAELLASALRSGEDVGPVVDLAWRAAYAGRELHPVSEAEKVALRDDGTIARIGKSNVSSDEAAGEFIGMLRLSAAGASLLQSACADAAARFAGRPFQTARTFEAAYLTDALQHLVEGGTVVRPVPVSGGWREIDTPEDLERAERWLAAARGAGQDVAAIPGGAHRA